MMVSCEGCDAIGVAETQHELIRMFWEFLDPDDLNSPGWCPECHRMHRQQHIQDRLGDLGYDYSEDDIEYLFDQSIIHPWQDIMQSPEIYMGGRPTIKLKEPEVAAAITGQTSLHNC